MLYKGLADVGWSISRSVGIFTVSLQYHELIQMIHIIIASLFKEPHLFYRFLYKGFLDFV